MFPILFLFLLPLIQAAPYCSLRPPKSVSTSTTPISSPSSVKGSTSGPVNGSNLVATSWYAGWHSSDFPPENVSWTKYNSITYSFATTTPDSSVISLAASDEQILPRFVNLAHQNNVAARLSIGGWTGSQYYSNAVATPTNQTTFLKAVLNLVSQYNLDGVDFDWEYPGGKGIGCNNVSPNDSANFLSFLQQLRADPAGKNLTLSASVSITPFAGSDGTPMTDVSGFAKVLNFIEVMNYDIWGAWSTSVGPNAPLNDTCASTKAGSAVSAVKAWTAAGFPAEQIVLGVASYGHSFSVPSASALVSGQLASYPPFNAAQQPHGDSWDGAAGVDQCGNPTPVGGIWDFWGLVQGGFLTNNGTAASGIDYRFDECSQTPYVYNPNTQVMVSYDDATSFAAKGRFIGSEGLGGFSMWETGGDFNNILLNSINGALGR